MIEDWIDALTKVWELDDQRGGTVHSYRLYERDEFPDVPPIDQASALTFVDSVSFEYSQGGPCIAIWRGSTEFVLSPSLDRQRIPFVMRFYGKIMRAAAANLKLGGLVDHFILVGGQGQTTIEGPLKLQYGQEAPRMGLVANWEVKERIVLTVGDPSVT